MRRREFLVGCVVATLCAGGARAETRKIGFVSWFSPDLAAHDGEQFRRGMRDLGYVEGRDFTLETYFTGADEKRTREVVRKLIREKVDILVAVTVPAIEVAKQEAGSLPIVMASVADPIVAGFAQSLSRPGGNLTGRTMFGPDLAAKRIDLLHEIRPGLRTVAFLGSSSALALGRPRFAGEMQAATDRIGMKLLAHDVESPQVIDAGVFEGLRRDGAEAVIIHPIFNAYHARIMPLANEAGLPVVGEFAELAQAGAVMTYGIDIDANLRRAAYFVDRIFKGARPADLPIEQPTETKLTINLAAAKRFGWTIPPSVLVRADEVIE